MTNPAPARECDCPPYVTRCVHYQGRMILLGDGALTMHSKHLPISSWIKQRYSVAVSKDSAPTSSCLDCGESTFKGVEGQRYSVHATEADALASFQAAEEQLLRGDA